MKTPTSAYISSFNDVTEANLQDHCLVIATKLKDATHVAIDLEFTGLCRSRQKDMNHRYVSMKRVVENGSMLSLGLSIFGKSKKTEKEEQNQTTEVPPPFAESYVCDNFNFLTKKKSSYVIDNDTKKFLTEHGFRFDRLEQEGIPFTPPNIRGNNHHSQTPSETGTYTLQTVWNQIMTEIAHYKVPLVVHNGLHDLLYIYSSFINPLPERWTEFVSRLPIHFPGGIFDTKYLVEAGPFGDASFLTYVFAKSDRDRQDRFTNSTQAKPYFEVVVNPAVYGKKSNNIPIEETKDDSKKRKASTDLEQVTIKKKKREYCYEYATYGYCGHVDLKNTEHDIQVILDNQQGPSIYPQVYTSKPADIEGMEGHHSAHFDAYMTAFTFLYLKHTLSPSIMEEGRNAVKIGSDNIPVRFPYKKKDAVTKKEPSEANKAMKLGMNC